MPSFSFHQVDVFTSEPLKGNPLAVVVDADGLSEATMASFANWTNLSETTFLLKPTDPAADYRLRIFTPERELPFAGHPTLGSCQVWLNCGNTAKQAEVVQECGAGLIRIRRNGNRLAKSCPASCAIRWAWGALTSSGPAAPPSAANTSVRPGRRRRRSSATTRGSPASSRQAHQITQWAPRR